MHACQNMEDAHGVLNLEKPPPQTLQYFVAVAKLRYALSFVAQSLFNKEEHGEQKIFAIAEKCCTTLALNEKYYGPRVFLVKQLYRQFGNSCLTRLTTDVKFEWVVPAHLRHNKVIPCVCTKSS